MIRDDVSEFECEGLEKDMIREGLISLWVFFGYSSGVMITEERLSSHYGNKTLRGGGWFYGKIISTGVVWCSLT